MKWIVGVSVIALAMGWAAIMTIPAATITPDETILKLLPPDTQAIAFIDAAALRNSPLVQDVLAKWPRRGFDRKMGDFVRATGFNIGTDVDRVTIARIGSRQMLAIVQARYDRFKAEQFFKDKGREPQTYMGRAVYSDAGAGNIVFMDNLIIAGQGDTVARAIDQMSLPGSLPLRSDLTDAIRSIEAGNQVWAVGDFSMAELPVALPGPASAVLELLKTLRSATYEMSAAENVHVRATGNFTTVENAANLSDMARGLIAVAKLQMAKQEDILHLLDGIQIHASGSSVVVNIDESGDLLKRLQNSRPMSR